MTREDAIAIIKEHNAFDRNITERDVSESMDKIRKLPSVQPKTADEIFKEFCRDVLHTDMLDPLEYICWRDSTSFAAYLLRYRARKVANYLGVTIEQVAIAINAALGKFSYSIPGYMLYEAMHPRKKPRGSIRRGKRSKRN